MWSVCMQSRNRMVKYIIHACVWNRLEESKSISNTGKDSYSSRRSVVAHDEAGEEEDLDAL